MFSPVKFRPTKDHLRIRRLFIKLSSRYFSSTHHDEEDEEIYYATSFRKCVDTSNLHLGRSLHLKFTKTHGPNFSTFINNHMINMYVKCGDLISGRKLFDEIPVRNVVSWTVLMSGFVQGDSPRESLSLFRLMLSEGERSNAFTLVSAVHACSLLNDFTQLYLVYGLVMKSGFESNVFLMNSFLTALIRHEKLGHAFLVFEKCENKDTVSWNAMMAGYLQFCYERVPEFWCRMNNEGVKSDNFTYSSVLTAAAANSDVHMGVQVHAQVVKCGHGDEMCVGNSLVDMYLKNQKLVDGLKSFYEMPCRDVASWTQMAAGCLQCGEPIKVVEVIGEMRRSGVKPNKFTLATLLNSCANMVSLEEGMKAHGLRVKLGDEMDTCVDNALLDMYAKCGSMDAVSSIFRLMKDRSVVSWTTLIMGYAQNGQAGEAIKSFDEMMLVGAKPNYITFICVLYACSQGGFIDEGWRYFSSMLRNHCIDPGEDHYACMVDLLSRSGRTTEAKELILSMPFKPGVLVWQTLLAACQIHGDMETGVIAAEHALNLDKKDSSTYVLLSNMFAGFSNWDGVGTLRELMETRDVRKMPGSSWG